MDKQEEIMKNNLVLSLTNTITAYLMKGVYSFYVFGEILKMKINLLLVQGK
jgi:hypothetical protein